MSLTEQWKRGELEDGHYYVKDDDLFVAEFFCGSFMVEEQIITINEVIAPVPTYEELQEQQATIDNLREIIRKKDEALEYYAKRNHLDFEEPNEPNQFFNYFDDGNDCEVWIEGGEKAQQALKIGEKE